MKSAGGAAATARGAGDDNEGEGKDAIPLASANTNDTINDRIRIVGMKSK